MKTERHQLKAVH